MSQHAFSQAEGLDASLPAISYAESWLAVLTAARLALSEARELATALSQTLTTAQDYLNHDAIDRGVPARPR